MTNIDEPFPIASPCVGVCKMDDERKYCIGCLRTIDEIKNWSRSDNNYKSAVVAQLRQRRRAIGRTSARDSRPRRR